MLTAPPPGFGHCFRDPYVWRADDTWQMLLGSTQRDDDVAAVLHYVSPDLAEWDFVGPLHVACDGDMGREAECPELFELDGRHVLVASDEHTRAVVGALDESGRFVPDGPAHTFDPGACYAARSVDIAGRRIQIAWVCDTRDRDASEAAGWRGALSVPRELTLDPDGRFRVAAADPDRVRRHPHPRGRAAGRHLDRRPVLHWPHHRLAALRANSVNN